MEEVSEYMRHQYKSVRAFVLNPFNNLVSSLFVRAHKRTFTCSFIHCHLTQGQFVLLSAFLNFVSCRLETVFTDISKFRERCIDIVLAEIVMIEVTAEISE